MKLRKFSILAFMVGCAVFSQAASAADGPNPLFQNKLWWFGAPNPNPPTPPAGVVAPISALQTPLPKPIFGWLDAPGFGTFSLGQTITIGAFGAIVFGTLLNDSNSGTTGTTGTN